MAEPDALTPQTTDRPTTDRRHFAIGAVASLAAIAAIATAAAATGVVSVPQRVRRMFTDTGPDGTIPQTSAGLISLDLRVSNARGREVGFFTAVPDGYGDGTGLLTPEAFRFIADSLTPA